LVDLAPPSQRVFEPHILAIGNVVADAAALEGAEARCERHFEQQARVG
jgi:hypothetical protein